ncbi:hypothetical protein C8R30_110115 [Nitrosomonas nitrosa]|uniref:Uncharacterized protein n=1 Tax=Nitrosomonas nitrosa TaxID=52442 RepID=A0A1I4S8G6_9PROT|nr:hypothetical protein [Nitrosomonas nitrosa]PTQ98402.1 hypothetical protein C8R30_110115 [Nitrosomonas nitrosa]SFM60795.1 hypothetical protein SAMN05421880_12318 [Nitrosomonas nitrosa]HNP50166.1 hypothetical protein [Nitrosomonas nitrosa]
MSLHHEISFETEICDHLAAHDWLYAAGDAQAYDRASALFPVDVVDWIKTTQPTAWETLEKNHGAPVPASRDRWCCFPGDRWQECRTAHNPGTPAVCWCGPPRPEMDESPSFGLSARWPFFASHILPSSACLTARSII